MVEHHTCNVEVLGSIPSGGYAVMPERLTGQTWNLMGFARVGSNPTHGEEFKRTFGVVVTYFPSKEMPRFRLPEGAMLF